MTHEEEQTLTIYLGYAGVLTEDYGFEDWSKEVRDGSDEGEAEYKEILARAQACLSGCYRGYNRFYVIWHPRALLSLRLSAASSPARPSPACCWRKAFK